MKKYSISDEAGTSLTNAKSTISSISVIGNKLAGCGNNGFSFYTLPGLRLENRVTFDGTLNVGNVYAVIEVARPQDRSEVVVAADNGLFQIVVDLEDGRWCLVYFSIFAHEDTNTCTGCVIPFWCIYRTFPCVINLVGYYKIFDYMYMYK